MFSKIAISQLVDAFPGLFFFFFLLQIPPSLLFIYLLHPSEKKRNLSRWKSLHYAFCPIKHWVLLLLGSGLLGIIQHINEMCLLNI